MRTQSQIDAIIRDVQSRLVSSQKLTGVDLQVPPGGYLEDGGWLNIVVTPVNPGVRAHQYVEALSSIERALRANGIQQVLLVPAISD